MRFRAHARRHAYLDRQCIAKCTPANALFNADLLLPANHRLTFSHCIYSSRVETVHAVGAIFTDHISSGTIR